MINNIPYPYLEMSDAIPIDSGAPAIGSLLLYMVLTGVDALPDRFPMPESLWVPTYDPHWKVSSERNLRPSQKGTQASRMDANCPTQLMVSSLELIPRGGRVFFLERVQPEAHDMTLWEGVGSDDEGSPATSPTSSLSMSTTTSPTPSLSLERPTSVASDTSEEDAAIPMINIQGYLGYGAIGNCYKGVMGPSTVVLKFARDGQEPAFAQEAFLYEHYLSPWAASRQQRSIAPKLYGHFSSDDHRILVLSYTGKSLESFDQLTLDGKTHLFDQVQTLHAIGIIHADLVPSNITQDDDGMTTIIDFSHSRLHNCHGKKKLDGYCEDATQMKEKMSHRTLGELESRV
ncbi:MAG: hypothetical protein M1826_005595 [Phylliscum demangeonii]|nr:MAG: hypothetical protein M1826_005595 [Phylliscum demangeonii]